MARDELTMSWAKMNRNLRSKLFVQTLTDSVVRTKHDAIHI